MTKTHGAWGHLEQCGGSEQCEAMRFGDGIGGRQHAGPSHRNDRSVHQAIVPYPPAMATWAGGSWLILRAF